MGLDMLGNIIRRTLVLAAVFAAFFGVSFNARADDARELYIDPAVGLWSFTEQYQVDPVVRAGGAVGFTYSVSENLTGRTRVQAMWLQGLDGDGRDVRVGTFVGWRNAAGGFEVGIDVFQNRYNLRDMDLHDSLGVEIPITMYLGPEFIYGIVGISPALLQHSERRVDWDDATLMGGFGHEFGWQVGVGSQINKTRVAVVYSRRQVSGQVIEGLNVAVGR
jgi:hypothetical protein